MTDLIFLGGPIVTMDATDRTMEALAVSNGTISALGSVGDVLATQDANTVVIDLAGAAVLPGFVEAHGHPTIGMSYRGYGVIDVRAATCPTSDDVLAAINEAVETSAPGQPLTAVGWEELLRPDLPVPSRQYLDDLAPENALAILHNSAHSAWGNTLALTAAGIDHNTPDPEGASYARDEDGNLTGRADELPATFTLAGSPLVVSDDEAFGLMSKEFVAYAAAGVTTVGELALDPTDSGLFGDLAAAQPSVRVRAYRMSNRPAKTLPAGDDMFQMIGVKLWADGSPWVGSIANSAPYLDNEVTSKLGVAGRYGCCNYTFDEIREMCSEALAAGEQVAVHAQGDAALDRVLDAIAVALEEVPTPDHRIRLEHCCLMTPDQYRRAASLGVTCSLFLAHVRYWGDVVTELFGAHAENWTAARSALDAGLRISLHNDVPVTPSEPLRNVQTAVTRRTAGQGRVLGPHERITVHEALRAVTIDAAWQLKSDRQVGSLEVGKLADLVMLSADPHDVDSELIDEIDVLATYLSGRSTYRA